MAIVKPLSAAALVRDLATVDTGVIYCDDNLYRLAQLPAESIDLIYLDPPFFSNRSYEVIWGDEAEVRSFEDRWEGGMNVYVNWMRERVQELSRVLKQTGSLYLHCDPHASHYLKVMADSIFGESNFRNEIIWKRTTAHSSALRFGPIHDTILCYGKGSTVTWNTPRTKYTAEYLNRYYHFDDGDGRLYWRADLCGTGTRQGSSGMPWRAFDPAAKGMHWKFTTDKLDELDTAGRIYWPRGGTKWPQYKRYRDELKGKAVPDIWDDIDRINPKARERMGYPTQKPEALLERIIGASSNPGGIVLDPFAGCGTTLVAAQRLRRRWIGIDISPTAVNLTHQRMLKVGATDVQLVGMPTTVDALRTLKPFEFQNWVIQRFNGTYASRQVHDYGIDGLSFFHHWPIQVKQSEHVGRNVIDNFETAMERVGKDQGYIVGFSFTRGAHEEVARIAKRQTIRLVTVAELLESVPDLIPRGNALFPAELPLPPARPADVRPSVEQLILSAATRHTRSAA